MTIVPCRLASLICVAVLLALQGPSAQDLSALQSLSKLNQQQYTTMAKQNPEAARKWAEANPEMAKAFLEQNPEAQQALADAQKTTLLDQSVKASQTATQDVQILEEHIQDTSAILDTAAIQELPETQSTGDTAKPKTALYGSNFFAESTQPLQLGRIVPPDYRLAEGDRIQLRFWGRINAEQILEIGSDGYVRIDAFDRREYVKGMTQRSLKETIHRVLEGMTGVSGDVQIISTQTTRLRVSGAAAKPGSFAIPPYFTFWQALQLSGGPSATGSLRDIRLVRSGRTVVQFDLYRYLQQGTYQDMALQDGDQIHFGPVGRVVELSKVARRDARFELTEKETLGDLITHAGGLRAADLGPNLHIERLTPPEQRRADTPPRQLIEVLLDKNWKRFALVDGDWISALERRAEIINEVNLRGEGAVLPGAYGFPVSDSSLAGLIARAGGLQPGALPEIEVLRLGNRGNEIFHLPQAQWSSFQLHRGDNILIYHQRQFQDSLQVGILGAVRKEINIPWSQGLTLAHLLRMAQGLRDVARPYVWVRRDGADGVVRWQSVPVVDAEQFPLLGRDQVFAVDGRRYGQELPLTFFYPGQDPLTLDYSEDLTLEVALHRLGELSPKIDRSRVELYSQHKGDPNVFSTMQVVNLDPATLQRKGLLQPGMSVIFRRSPEIRDIEFVTIEGEVLRPGHYPIQERRETVSELLARAGGLTVRANPHASVLIRNGEKIPLSEAVAKGQTSTANLMVDRGDSIRIFRDERTIKVAGSVLSPGKVPFQEGWGWSDYIQKGAGGMLDTADVDKIYIVHPNGQSYKANCGWFCFDRQPVSGSVIVIPHKQYISPEEYAAREEKKVSFAEVMQGVTATLTTVLLILIIVDKTN